MNCKKKRISDVQTGIVAFDFLGGGSRLSFEFAYSSIHLLKSAASSRRTYRSKLIFGSLACGFGFVSLQLCL